MRGGMSGGWVYWASSGCIAYRRLNLPHPIYLPHPQTLSPGSVKNPICIVANYLFDTLCHDIFQVRPSVLAFLACVHVRCAHNPPPPPARAHLHHHNPTKTAPGGRGLAEGGAHLRRLQEGRGARPAGPRDHQALRQPLPVPPVRLGSRACVCMWGLHPLTHPPLPLSYPDTNSITPEYYTAAEDGDERHFARMLRWYHHRFRDCPAGASLLFPIGVRGSGLFRLVGVPV